MPTPEEALLSRDTALPLTDSHFVLNTPLRDGLPDHLENAMFGLGCFWGAEKRFWSLEGAHTTAVATVRVIPPTRPIKVCSGRTGHNDGLGGF